tara:strand:+ start:193 stop:450 length:258 start_codon:yes stop_codon:yes gene_type:complete
MGNSFTMSTATIINSKIVKKKEVNQNQNNVNKNNANQNKNNANQNKNNANQNKNNANKNNVNKINTKYRIKNNAIYSSVSQNDNY